MRRRSPSGPAKANEVKPRKQGWRGTSATPEQRAEGLAKAQQTKRKWTKEERRQQLLALEQLMLEGRSDREIRNYFLERFQAKRHRVIALTAIIHHSWEEEDANNRRSWKSKSMRRLERYIRTAEGRRAPSQHDPHTGNVLPGPWIEKPNHQALARYTSLLMDIQGTRAPLEIKVDVLVSESLTHVIANLSSDDVQQIIEQHAEDRRLAMRARELLPPSEFVTNGASHAAE